jgi:hypothetical protein
LTGVPIVRQSKSQERPAGKRPRRRRLSITTILAWADAHHRRAGRWPTRQTGPVLGMPGETWRAIDEALRYGYRGLRSGSSVARLLAQRRNVPNRMAKPPLSQAGILRWADAHRQRTGQWPNSKSGPVLGVPHETWKGIDQGLRQGWRGLKRGPSLAQLLARKRHARNRVNLPRLAISRILGWADEHYQLHGVWPTQTSGPVGGAPAETWGALNQSLRYGYRGLPGGVTLAELLNARRR